jgi:hypothetical protein
MKASLQTGTASAAAHRTVLAPCVLQLAAGKTSRPARYDVFKRLRGFGSQLGQ